MVQIKKQKKTTNLGQRHESAQSSKSDWGENSRGARTQMHYHTQNAYCRLGVGQHARL